MTFSLSAQYDAKRVEFLGNFDDQDLPTHNLGTYNDVWGFTANFREYAILGSAAFIHIIDVTDPTKPVEVSRLDPNSNSLWRDFKTYCSYGYAIADGSPDGLTVIDLSNPQEAEIILQDTEQFGRCHNIFIDAENGRLYTAGCNRGTYIYDLSEDPANPNFLGRAPIGDRTIHDIFVRDNIAYCSAEYEGYYIYDLSNPNNEKFMASAETGGYNHSSWVSEDGSFALFAEEVPLGLPMGIMDLEGLEDGDIEVNNYFQFPLIEDADPGPTPHNPFIIGNYAYVSYYHDGLMVFDIRDKTNVKRVGYFDTFESNTNYNGYRGAWGCYPFLPSGTILISDIATGLYTLDFELDDNRNNCHIPSTCGPLIHEVPADQTLQLFPNPTSGVFKYLLPRTDATFDFHVYNAAGQLMYVKRNKTCRVWHEANLSDLAPGLYIIVVKIGDEYQQKKLIIA